MNLNRRFHGRKPFPHLRELRTSRARRREDEPQHRQRDELQPIPQRESFHHFPAPIVVAAAITAGTSGSVSTSR